MPSLAESEGPGVGANLMWKVSESTARSAAGRKMVIDGTDLQAGKLIGSVIPDPFPQYRPGFYGLKPRVDSRYRQRDNLRHVQPLFATIDQRFVFLLISASNLFCPNC